MKFKYVGLKEDGETAFAALTGIERWMPGDQHEIAAPALAARMQQHPDVWELVTEEAVKVLLPQSASTVAAPAPLAVPVTSAPVAPAGPSLAPGALIAPPPAVAQVANVIITPEGQISLDGLEKDELRALCARLQVKAHPALGVPKLTAALLEAFPVAPLPAASASAGNSDDTTA